ncbi:glycoside hydrolase family 13 protein [Rhizoctonia solani AG-1 IA]|uniref:alpha-amylase n=1 Tax=Thanatephorus cucumeris (strain AG1-IA) TaxID=983506 RepID=L8WJA6_THACA|nr:glycoside hydrolase family 13 protein [Rhizoctonia solani AG-1 IA]
MRTSLSFVVLLAVSANAARRSSHLHAAQRMHRRAPNSDKSGIPFQQPCKLIVLKAPFTEIVVQMFGWNWNSIGDECVQFLGPTGVGFVQVNPPQEHLAGDQWWVDYQVVSYQLQSKRGSRAEFAGMINKCKGAGVKVMVDTIWNHMAGVDNVYLQQRIDRVLTDIKQDFHHCVNFRHRVHSLKHTHSLNSNSEYVQGKLAEFTNDLLGLGVDGLPITDIHPWDIGQVINRLSRKPDYITQEIVDTSGSMVGMYTGIGDIQETYPDSIGIGWLASNLANVFVTNHDQEHDGAVLSYKSASNTYTLAHVFMLVLQTAVAYGTCYGAGGVNNWVHLRLCQHRWTPIAGMIGFYNQVGNAGLTNWAQGSNQQIAFGRGSVGFVAINNENWEWTSTFQTSLPSGTYCDVASGKKEGNGCTGGSVTVSNGSFTVTIPGRSAVGYHTGAKEQHPYRNWYIELYGAYTCSSHLRRARAVSRAYILIAYFFPHPP